MRESTSGWPTVSAKPGGSKKPTRSTGKPSRRPQSRVDEIMRGRLSRLMLLVSLIGVSPSAAWAHDSARFDALVGLARSERAAGRPARALDLFRQADQLQRLDAKLLAEFFWTA